MMHAEGAPEKRRNLIVACLLLLVGGVIWGATFALAKLVTGTGAHPFGIAMTQGVIGALLLFPYCLARYGGIPLGRDHCRVYVVAGALGTALPSSIMFFAASHMPSGILAIIISLVPLMTYCIALMIRIERLALRRAIGIALGLGAVLMIVVPDTGLPDRAMVGWVLFALLMPLSYSGENVYIAIRRPAKSNPFALLCGMLAAGSLIMLPLVWATDSWIPLSAFTSVTMIWIVGLTLVNVVGYLMFLELIVLAGPLFAAQMGYVVTAAGVLWGIILFDESLSSWVWAALAVLFAGIALVQPRISASDPPDAGP